MAKKNAGDILTCDWNPVVGCQRYSRGCRKCWFLDGFLSWKAWQSHLPHVLQENEAMVVEGRMNPGNLKPKNGIVGIAQHGDLFWDRFTDATIARVLDIVDQVAREKRRKGSQTKYVLWTKRAGRMADIMAQRYPEGLPAYWACGVSVEDQKSADDRLPHLLRIRGHRFIMIEPMLGPIDLADYLDVQWVVLGSETGKREPASMPTPLDPAWARAVRDQVKARGIPFFIKQLGDNHRRPQRELDGRTWDEFPAGFSK